MPRSLPDRSDPSLISTKYTTHRKIGRVYRGAYAQQDTVALAHYYVLGGSPIMCVHPNELRKKPLIDELDENSPKDNTLQAAILAAMKLGSSRMAEKHH